MNLLKARLIFKAGGALIGIWNYLHQGPSTNSADFVDDARRVLEEHYTPQTISKYVQVLKNHGLNQEATEIEQGYNRLVEIAQRKI